MNCPHCEIENIDAEVQRNNDEIQKLAARNNELATLRQALQERLKLPIFDEGNRIVRWQGGNLKLSPQRFKILYTLYFAENRQMEVTDLETAIWEEARHSVIKTAISKLDILLSDAGFPFYIESVKSKGGDRIEVRDRKGHRIVKTRPALVGFKLVSRVSIFGNPSVISDW